MSHIPNYLRDHPAQEIAIIWLSYVLAFVLLSWLGSAVMLLAILPIMAVAFEHGRKAGWLAGFIAVILNLVMGQITGQFELSTLIISSIGGISAGVVVGELRESEANFRILVSDSPDTIFTMALNGKITSVNPVIESNTGWQRKEVIGHDFSEFVHPSDVALARALMNRFMRGESLPLFELRIRTRQDSYLIAQFTVTAQRKDTAIIGMIGVARNVTSHKKAEAKLRESEERYRQLVEQSPDPIIVHSEMKIVYGNTAALALLGATVPTQLIGRPILDLAAREEREVVAEIIRKNYLNKQIFHPQSERVMKLNGELVDVEMISASVTYSGKPARQLIIRDITQRKRMQAQELELALERERIRVLRQFISNASHDLKTPLSTIRLNLYLLKNQRDTSRHQELVEMVEDRFLHLEKLVDDLFNMSRLDSETALDFQLQPLSLSALVRQVIEARRIRAEESGITLSLEVDETVGRIHADPDEFYTALDHLVENALTYTRPGGLVALRTYTRDSQVVIEVQDTGIGIAEAALPRIFDRFYRGDDARSTYTGGTGLGLSIAQRIVEFHNGTIEVESQMNEGSTFRICLPRR